MSGYGGIASSVKVLLSRVEIRHPRPPPYDRRNVLRIGLPWAPRNLPRGRGSPVLVMLAKKNTHHLYGGPRLLTLGLPLDPTVGP